MSGDRGRTLRFCLAAALVLAGCAKRAPWSPPPASPICYECFWDYQHPVLREELLEFYRNFETDDPLIQADVLYLMGRVAGDPADVCRSFRAFAEVRAALREPARRLFADEAMAFTAGECGWDPAPLFRRASRSARALGEDQKAKVYARLARGRFRPRFGRTAIQRSLEVPEDAEAFILGESAIHVPPGWTVGVQVERIVRDWLSYQMRHAFTEASPDREELLWYHEGARMRDLLGAVPADVEALSGTLAVREGDRWFAPDEEGIFRFEVLLDKVQYPTTRAHGDVALLVDTHGLSSLVEAAVRRQADLVVGCGDYTGKVEAAYHMARLGMHVYFPCDRFVGDLIGHDAEGVLLGSAPVRREGEGAVIGDRPIRFRVDEVIVVQDTSLSEGYQYYDAPARYFRRLAEWLPLRLEWIPIRKEARTRPVVERAEQVGSSVIAVRVADEDDYLPVRDWLSGSPDRRAVLFHSAPYPAGYRLFQEFPGQTTFGDPRPRFLPNGR